MTLAPTIYIFLSIAAIFYLVAAIQTSRTFLIPAGGILILLGGMMLITSGIQVQDGTRTEQIDTKMGNNQTEKLYNETIVYREVDREYNSFSPSNLLAIILIFTGTASMIVGADQRGELLKAIKQ